MERKNVFLGGLIFLLTIGLIYLYFQRGASFPDYVISGVSPLTIFSAEVINSPIRTAPAAALVTVLRYWGQNPDLSDVNDVFFPGSNKVSYNGLSDYAQKTELTARVQKLQTPSDLKKFINPEVRTPLIARMLIAPAPDIARDSWVIIGVSEEKQKITVHSWYNGNNQEISFQDLDRFWQNTSAEDRYQYLVIQPTRENFKEAIKKIPTNPAAYPPRLKIMDFLSNVFLNINKSLSNSKDEAAEVYLKQAIQDPHFPDLAPWLQIRYRTRLAELQIRLGKYGEAKKNLDLSENANHDLDKPYGEWPAHTVLKQYDGKIYYPYRVYAKYYRATGDELKAIEFSKKDKTGFLFKHD